MLQYSQFSSGIRYVISPVPKRKIKEKFGIASSFLKKNNNKKKKNKKEQAAQYCSSSDGFNNFPV